MVARLYPPGTLLTKNKLTLNITLQVRNIQKLCNAVVLRASSYEPSIVKSAEKIQRKFCVTLTLFSKCHNIYNQNMITQEEIASLGKFKLCKMTTYHVNLLQRYSHLHLYDILSGAISSSNRHTKDAHAREACG